MSMLHEFGILSKSDKDYADKRAWRKIDFHELRRLMRPVAELDDDIINYLSDSLVWIPVFDPFNQGERHGLNQYGITVITKSGAQTAGRIFTAWADLFALSPDELNLTG